MLAGLGLKGWKKNAGNVSGKPDNDTKCTFQALGILQL
jgi:hypothetical protein